MPEDDFKVVDEQLPATAQDESAAQLEQRVSALTAKMGEERFIWSIVVMLLVDFIVLERIANWAASLAILTLEIILLLVMARKCGVPDVNRLLDRALEFYGARNRHANAHDDNENNA